MITSLLTTAVARARSKSTGQPTDGKSLVADQRGALTFIEWIIIFAVVIVVIAIAAGELADTVDEKFGEIGDTVQGLETTID
jgi:Flp pilus assembly pilin Flp